MSIAIAQNIKSYRKALGITQEQLAEAVGVSIGAVSKWESGLSNPDIELIIELADFFETSVDVLLGYKWQKLSMGKTAERLEQFGDNRDYEQGVKEAEKALVKYPNCFDIIYYSANIYYFRGLEQHDKSSMERALTLFQKAILFIGQNKDPKISELSIQNKVGDVYMLIGEFDTAISHLKKYNVCGNNTSSIGLYLVAQGKTEEAMEYLSDSMIDAYSKMFRGAIGLVNCYDAVNKFQLSIDCFEWIRAIGNGLRNPDKVTFIDRYEALILAGEAIMYYKLERPEQANSYLQQAYDYALRFDQAPDYSCCSVKFYEGKDYQVHDDFGPSTVAGILDVLIAEGESCLELVEAYKKIMDGGNAE